ncbi:Ubiquitin hydrolase [Echinococcus granulosus]|uniref:Ubiquitin hydrolase n=1 Tax=Echinococcus granulosus TaxID=6210 RepID=W6UMZ4_ECHGR|nr:Ubiquitin hydrolase [Echinococcus granulosus]EUB54894.1 Ubiquitin hydrolase [Echinococcus granulosus]
MTKESRSPRIRVINNSIGASSRVVVDFAGTDSSVSVPKKGGQVFKDECVFSFAASDDKNGLLICLRTFLGVDLDFMDGYNLIDDEHFKPRKLANGTPGGFELPDDKYTVSERWCLRCFLGGQTVDVPCPVEDSAVTDMSHLEGLGLTAKVMSCINKVLPSICTQPSHYSPQ